MGLISMGKFKAEISRYTTFNLTYDEPLDPFALHFQFSQAAVALSASPYIAFKGDGTSMAVSHVTKISKLHRHEEDGSQKYTIHCNDLKKRSEMVPIQIVLVCS